MKVQAILKGSELIFPKIVLIKKPEVMVDVEIPDEDIQLFTEEELKKMPFDTLVELGWRNTKNIEEINKDYKELLVEALEEKYK